MLETRPKNVSHVGDNSWLGKARQVSRCECVFAGLSKDGILGVGWQRALVWSRKSR